MDDDSAELGEPVSPEDTSSTGSQNEDEMDEADNSGVGEHKMDSSSDSNEEMEISELQANTQVENMTARIYDQGQYQTVASRIDSDNDMESETRESTIGDEQSGETLDNQETVTEDDERDVSPMQSSVSEVSSENEQDEGINISGTEPRETKPWGDDESDSGLLSSVSRIESPKEEKLDYGASDDENVDDEDNIHLHGSEFSAADINISSSGNLQLDRRKSPHQGEMGDVDNVSQAEEDEEQVEDFHPKMDSREREVDDVSEQSGEESLEDQPSEPPLEIEPERKVTDGTKKDEELDDVSDQSDTDVEEESRTKQDTKVLSEQVENNEVQEALDDVSDQSEDDRRDASKVADDDDDDRNDEEIVNTSLENTKSWQETVAQNEQQKLESKDLDDVSESDESEAPLDKEPQETEEKPNTPEIPPNQTLESQEPVMEVHHHGDELDFEEELEEREEEEEGHTKERMESSLEQKELGGKQDKDEDGKGEIESGEEGEMDDDDDEGIQAQSKDGEAGEIEDDEAEEGEVKDPEDKKPLVKPVCRFFARGQCTWGPNCRFLHPGVNDLGNYSFIDFKEIEENTAKLLNKEINPPPPPVEEAPPPEDIVVMEPYIPPPPIPEEPLRESAWERGIRQAKEARKKVERRKELGIREAPQYIVEETYDDFDMESAFHPDVHSSTAEQYGYAMEPDPEYNPQREMRERRREARPPMRHEPPPPSHHHRHPPPHKRPEPYREPKFRENRVPRKDQFGRDFARRPPPAVERSSAPQSSNSSIPKHYPPEKSSTFQYREKREERTRPAETKRKPADAWQDPWARTRSPKPKSKQQTKSRNRSGSVSSGSSVSRSRSRSYSSGSSRSSSASSFSSKSDSRSPSPTPQKKKPAKPIVPQSRERMLFGLRKPPTEGVKMGLKKPPGIGEKTPPVKKMGLQLPPQKTAKPPRRSMSNSSISSASRSRSRSLSKSPVRSRPRPAAGAKPRGRRRRTSSGSSHVSISSKSSADSDHMYANLASPVSSSSSPDRINTKRAKAKQREKFPSSKPPRTSDVRGSRPKAMVTVPSMEAFREPPVQVKKAAKPANPKITTESKSKSTSAPAQMMSRAPVKHSTHKDIKLTLLNKPSSDGKKRYEVLGDGATKKVKPVAPVKPTTKVTVDKERRPVKPLQQTTKKSAPSAMVAPVRTAAVKPSVPSDRSERKRPPSPFSQRDQPPSKTAHKAGSGGASKSRDPATAKKATVSRREEILKQLKAVEDMIARKKAKMKN